MTISQGALSQKMDPTVSSQLLMAKIGLKGISGVGRKSHVPASFFGNCEWWVFFAITPKDRKKCKILNV